MTLKLHRFSMLLTMLWVASLVARAADGYGGGATGGAGGTAVTVTSSAQLLQYANLATPCIITVSGTIDVTGGTGGDGKSVKVLSNKTIQGADATATIIGCLDLGTTGGNNIIIQNLNITHPGSTIDPATGKYADGGDGITVWGTTHVFITHCTFRDCADGACDITQGADYVTVSWCKFYYTAGALAHKFAMILGNTDPTAGPDYRVTLDHNWWAEGCDQRMPSGSYSTGHLYNNYFSCTGNSYCTNGRVGSQYLVENNYYKAVKNPCYKQDGGLMFLSGNIFSNCTGYAGGYDSTVGALTGNDTVITPSYTYSLDPAADVPAIVMTAAGVPQLIITAAGSSIVSETGVPSNQVIDVGETVTVNLSLADIGAGSSANLQATLLATDGVTLPGGPQIYGSIPAGGAAVGRSFTFTASASASGTITATLQLQDGALQLDPVMFSFPVGTRTNSFTQNFDGTTAPALPAGWTTAKSNGQALWMTSIANRDTLPNAAFTAAASSAGVNEIVSPAVTISGTSPKLIFRHSYNLQSGFDGAVLQMKIGSGAFTDVVTAGGTFVSGGYPATLSSTSNPLGKIPAWTGNSGGFVTTEVDLPAAIAGQSVQFKWRCGSNSSTSSPGWYMDSVALSAVSSINTSADLAISHSTYPDPAVGGENLSYTLTVINNGPGKAADVKVTDTLPSGVEFVSATTSQGGAALAGGIVTGKLETLAVGASATLVTVVRPPAAPAGTISHTATVSSNQADPASGNSSVVIETAVVADTDGDGMPDTFEAAKGMNPADPADAAGDLDHDGFRNLAEFRAGTDPANPNSLLRFSALSVASGTAHLTFPTVAGKKYRLECADSPGAAHWALLRDQVVGTGADMAIEDAGAGASPRKFYRLCVNTP